MARSESPRENRVIAAIRMYVETQAGGSEDCSPLHDLFEEFDGVYPRDAVVQGTREAVRRGVLFRRYEGGTPYFGLPRGAYGFGPPDDTIPILECPPVSHPVPMRSLRRAQAAARRSA